MHESIFNRKPLCSAHITALRAATAASNLSPFVVSISQAIIMDVGTEWLVDAEGCSEELLRNVEVVRSVCEEVVSVLGLRVVGEPLWHQFPQPAGVTGLYLLTESHLSCHTFPETRVATFNLYCCKPRPAFAWDERLRLLLGAARVNVRLFARGSEAASDASIELTVSELTSSREVGA